MTAPAPAPYTIGDETLGHLRKQLVTVAYVPRQDFVDAMDRVIDANSQDLGDDVITRLRDTARTMDRFPFGAWVHRERGCGCLVGEYLIAADALSRDDGAGVEVDFWLQETYPQPVADALYNVGIDADVAAKDLAYLNGIPYIDPATGEMLFSALKIIDEEETT